MSDHYFSENPASHDRRSRKTLTLRGHTFDVEVASGTFSPGGLDRGTAVLLNTVPAPAPSGVLVDVGCGWGPITLALASSSPNAQVYGVDVNRRALDLTSTNAQTANLTNVTAITPEEFPEGTAIETLWSNPPIRIGKSALHQLLTTWLQRLSDSGEAWLVVAKNLGAESLLRWLNTDHDGIFTAERIGRDKGYHVIRVVRTA